MATQNYINECKNRANANRLAKFNLQNWDNTTFDLEGNTLQDGTPTPDNPVEIQTVTGEQNVNVYSGKNLFNNNGTMYQSTGATVETIDTGIRATILRTGNNRYGKVVIPNSNELLGKTVTLSANFNSSASNTGRIALYQISSTGGVISGIGMLDNTGSITLTIPSEYSTNAVTLALLFYANTSGTSEVNDYVDYTNVQLELGSQVTEYEEYIGQDYKINLGKNLINNIETTQTINGITYTVNDDGSVLVNGTATALTILNIIGNNTFTLPAGIYTLSGCPSGGSNSTYRLDINDGARTEWRDYGNSSAFALTEDTLIRNVRIRIASGATIDNLLFKPMLEKGSQATPYSPYFTPIELCKIEDYKDRIYKQNDTWYIEKNIGKVVLDGSESWSYNNELQVFLVSNLVEYLTTGFIPYSNYYKGQSVTQYKQMQDGYISFLQSTTNNRLIIKNTNIITVEDLKSWLSTHNTIVYYVLATPTYTEITDTNLIEVLNTLYNDLLEENAENVFVSSSYLPIILDLKYYKNNVEISANNRFYEINQTNHLASIELKESSYVNNTIIGSIFTKSAEVKLLNLPQDTQLVNKTIIPKIGVKYANDTTEYIDFDKYIIESIKDEQTASNTNFTAMNGGTLLDKEYVCSLSFENGATHTINEFYQDACNQIGLTPTDVTFDNSELVMTGNPFTNKETIRTVLSEVEKTSCSIINFDWKAKTISLTWLSSQIDYEFNTSDYSTLEGSLTQYGPLNVIILGNSQLDGENIVMTDEQSVSQNGEHQILIDSPYFLYTEALRNQAIQAIYNKLDGLTYYDLKLTTPYGKPFLKIGNKIRINTNENQVYDTYVLTHTFTYDGAFKSIIESPALTSAEQTVKNEFKNNSMKERLKRTEVIVDKATGDITAITQRVETAENELGNMYTKEQVNTLVQNAETGLTNTFSEAGGNNIFRNTGLWFTQSDSNNPYEFWTGIVEKVREEKSASSNALLLQNTTLVQEQDVPNGNYTISFKYKKLIQASQVKCVINDVEYILTATEDTEFVQPIEVNSQHINIKFISNIDNACEIYDLMVNAGAVKLAYSQNQNETTTDTVNISKGITITSSQMETTFKANADGVRIYDSKDLTKPKTEFTDRGTETDYLKVKNEAEIVSILIQKVGNHTWFTKI